jgi:predicted RNase H-like HicB family nuclease
MFNESRPSGKGPHQNIDEGFGWEVCSMCMNLTAVIYPDSESEWLVAHNPETGTTTQGRNFDEALANLKEATELYLSEFPLKTKSNPILTTFEVSEPECSHA